MLGIVTPKPWGFSYCLPLTGWVELQQWQSDKFSFLRGAVWHSCTQYVYLSSTSSKKSDLIVQCEFLAGVKGGGEKQKGGSMTHDCWDLLPCVEGLWLQHRLFWNPLYGLDLFLITFLFVCFCITLSCWWTSFVGKYSIPDLPCPAFLSVSW